MVYMEGGLVPYLGEVIDKHELMSRGTGWCLAQACRMRMELHDWLLM
jgi:3-methyladenine DNA glycosylase AlkD